MKRLFTAAVLLAITTISANAQLVINEIMQSNVECIMDDIKEFPDSWVELYNSGSTAVNLKDYKIGTQADGSKSWQLPNKTVLAGGYVIIYCDKEEKGLHTSFRLESDKVGNLYLFQGSAIVSSVVGIPVMPAPDVAYGRKTTDDGDIWGYELKPTPGNPNEGDMVAATQILGAPEFGQKGFVSSSAFDFYLTLSKPVRTPEGAYITYTMDGSEPTAESTRYTTPIRIKTTNTDNNRTKVIRAKVFCDGYLSPVSTTQSYIYHPREMKIPIISILTKNAYIYDNAIGIYPNNKDKDHQVDWRRPINIEMFISENSESVFNQLGETRIQGGQSRANKLKSMAIYANKRFGPKNKRFSYEFFPDQKPGITEFKSFSLRDGGNDFGDLYFRDLIIQRTMGPNTDLDWQAGRPAVLYINGVYKGMINIRERSNEDNIYSNYNGLEDVDEIEIGHKTVDNEELYIEELKEGTMDFYDDFWAFYSEGYEQGITPDYSLEEYEEWMDVSEYLNVMITNLFYCNIDFPGNNIVFWRPNKKKSGLPMRWRFIIKDTDFGLGLYNWSETSNSSNTIDMIYNPTEHSNSWAFSNPKASLLFRNMMENTDIKNMFIDKSCVFMGDFMNAEGTGAVIDDIKDKVLKEFVAHRAVPEYYVWGGSSETEIINKFKAAKSWVEGRPDNFLQYISQKYLNGKSSVPVTINKGVATTELPDEVLVNGIKLTKGVFDGKLFLDRLITLEAKNNIENDYSVTGWEIKKNGVSEEPVEGTTYNFTVPSCSKLEINAVKVHKPQVTISEYGAVSFSSLLPLDFTDMPVEAYIVTEKDGNSFTKEQVYKVPANTGIIIEGAEGTYKIPVASISTVFDNVSNNLLWSTADAAFTVPDDGSFYYGLFYSYDQQKLGLKMQPVGETFDKGKSYLCLTQQQSKQKPEIYFDEIISGVATNIQGIINNNTWTNGQIYNLNGQRVDKNYKGVIIVNGKKVVNNRN